MQHGKSKGLFYKRLTPEAMERMYRVLGSGLSGETAVKVHSGEMGNQNFIRPDFMKKVIEAVNGTVVECNTAYEGKRNTTKEHWETMKAHGWTEHFRVDIMDEDGELELPVEGGKQISVNYVGKNLQNYDSILVLSHFKGHPMGGFGGALKNISIGIASSHGKAHIHGAGHPEAMWTAIMIPSWKPWPMLPSQSWRIERTILPFSTLCAICPLTVTAAPWQRIRKWRISVSFPLSTR